MGVEGACSVLSETLKIPFLTKQFEFSILTSIANSRIDDMDEPFNHGDTHIRILWTLTHSFAYLFGKNK